MNIKLAEYNAQGKFERFLELGKGFAYFGDYIGIADFVWQKEDELTYFEFEERENYRQSDLMMLHLYKDEKDPLNRFNGLFDGRTYGDGKFVLIENNQDDIAEETEEIKHVLFKKNKDKSHSRTEEENVISNKIIGYRFSNGIWFCGGGGGVIKTKWNGDEIWEEKQRFLKIIGNIHQSPELWEKVK